MKKLLCTAALLGLLVPAIGAQGQSTPPAQEKKPEAKAAPSPAGKWDVTVMVKRAGKEIGSKKFPITAK